MPLQKNNIPISFTQGIDTKTDVKQVVAGKLTTLENGIFQTTKEIRKRNGYANLGVSIEGGGSIAAGVALTTFKQELDLFDGTSLYSYSQGSSNWDLKGQIKSVGLTVNPIVRNNTKQTMQDSAYLSGLQCFVYEDSSGGVKYSVVDYQTKDQVVTSGVISATGSKPKVVAFGTRFVIFYVELATTTLKYKTILVTTPTVLSSSTTITTDIDSAGSNHDEIVFNSRIYLTYARNSVANINVHYLDSSFVLSAAYVNAGNNAEYAISILNDGSNNAWIFYSRSNAPKGLRYFITDAALVATVLADTSVDPTASVRNITGVISGTTATIYYEVPATNTYNTFIKTTTASLTGTIGSLTVLVRSLGVNSKAFSYGGSNYFLAAHDSMLQSRYFLLNGSGNAVAKLSAEPYLGGGITTKAGIPQVTNISTGVYEISYLQKRNIGETSTLNEDNNPVPTSITLSGVQDVVFSFLVDNNSQYNDIGNNLHIPTGILSAYDGATVNEHGFNVYPENVIAKTDPTGGALGSGTYQYSAVYRWIDNYGQIHRSAPSIPVTVVVGGTDSLAFAGSQVAASANISNVSNSDGLYYEYGISSGTMIITGSGIPDNSYLTAVAAGTSTISNPAGTTLTSNQYVATPVYTGDFHATASSKLIYNVADPQYINIYGAITSGSAVWVVNDTTLLGVGMTVESYLAYLPGGTTILSISGHNVTLSAAATATSVQTVMRVSMQFVGHTVNGSNVVSNVPASIIALITVNQTARNVHFPNAQERITTIGATSFTIADNANATDDVATFINFRPDQVYRAGQLIIESNVAPTSRLFDANTVIEKIEFGYFSDTGANNKITISKTAIRTGHLFVYLKNAFQGFVSVPTLRVTGKAKVVIDLYRTEANQTIFYRVSSLDTPTYNDTSVDVVEFYDNLNDISIIGNDQLYTTGGEVENIAVPSSDLMTIYKNRIIAVPSENPLSFWYSKEVIPNTPVEFSDVFVQNIDQKGGNITAVSQLDDKLILFKKSQIFYLVGDGPAPSGANNDFTLAQLVTTDSGCINKNSVVIMPAGVMYQSQKGIYLLDRSLQVNYIGADVEFYNDQTITSAKLIPNTNQVRFTLGSGIALVYDYYVGQWSVFTGIASVSATVFNSIYTYLQSPGIVSKETVGVYTDSGAFIKLKAVSSWLSFAGLQGFQRAYKMLILGEYKSAHSLIVKVAYDFNQSYVQTDTIIASTGSPYQYRIFFARQKCESILISIEDSQSGSFGEGFSISALGLEVGVKAGLNKITAAKSYG